MYYNTSIMLRSIATRCSAALIMLRAAADVVMSVALFRYDGLLCYTLSCEWWVCDSVLYYDNATQGGDHDYI